jgi:hypothetical protein
VASSALPETAPGEPPETGCARVDRRLLAAYSLPNLGIGAMVGLVLIYFLKFATDVLLIPPALVGGIFGAARIWDAITDPLAGHWSDRTNHALGRRSGARSRACWLRSRSGCGWPDVSARFPAGGSRSP